jgi:hypothetical protein
MPIRTPRGRSAAYRSLWQWPLRSPARFIGCVVVLLGLAVGLNAATGLIGGGGSTGGLLGATGGPRPGAAPATAAPGAAAPAAPTRLPPVPELTPATLPPSQAPPAALTAATKWTQAWARHPAGTTPEGWVNGLRPFTTDEYLGVLSTVDPANVPATKVTGNPRAVLVSPRSVRVEVPTDALTVLVLVVNTGTEWRVAGYDRASPGQQAQPPG